ncbi:MAG: hypothetical protein S4CHLAM45_14850 [Chlamydiales bacterium]|nr:hypothetical protein [Chlamydiales bacterium]MCH9620102.1 hypothetical protein [Chlamydiales bacterium]MCH9623572.1 hypothetical protein [Chlamydiales bacterium]
MISGEYGQILLGLRPGYRLAYNSTERSFRAIEQKEQKYSVPDGFDTDLKKVTEATKTFFSLFPQMNKDLVLNKIERRIAPYKGVWGWFLTLTFRGAVCNQIVTNFEALSNAILTAPIPELPEVPSNGVRAGVNRRGTNACWFISTLKLFSQVSYFDEVFKPKEGDTTSVAELKQLYSYAIYFLRKRGQGVLSQTIVDALQRAIEKQFPEHKFARQCDADEYIRILLDFLGWHGAEDGTVLATACSVYKDPLRYGEKAPTVHFPEEITIIETIPDRCFEEEASLNLNELVSFPDKRRLNDEMGFDREFTCSKAYLNLPSLFMVKLKRIQALDPLGERKRKCKAPIEMEGGERLVFDQYHMNNAYTDIIPHTQESYQVKGALIHIGGAHGGHYVFESKNPDGSITRHNDSEVTEKEEFDPQALFLILEKIEDQ